MWQLVLAALALHLEPSDYSQWRPYRPWYFYSSPDTMHKTEDDTFAPGDVLYDLVGIKEEVGVPLHAPPCAPGQRSRLVPFMPSEFS